MIMLNLILNYDYCFVLLEFVKPRSNYWAHEYSMNHTMFDWIIENSKEIHKIQYWELFVKIKSEIKFLMKFFEWKKKLQKTFNHLKSPRKKKILKTSSNQSIFLTKIDEAENLSKINSVIEKINIEIENNPPRWLIMMMTGSSPMTSSKNILTFVCVFPSMIWGMKMIIRGDNVKLSWDYMCEILLWHDLIFVWEINQVPLISNAKKLIQTHKREKKI